MAEISIDYSNLTVDYVDQLVDSIIQKYKDASDELLKLSDDNLSWNTYIAPDIELDNTINLLTPVLEMSNFCTDKDVRKACSDATTKLSQFRVEQTMRRDLFRQFKHYYNNQYQVEKNNLSSERQKYIEDAMTNYKLAGLDLDDESYNKVKEIKLRLTELCDKFDLNVNNENRSFEFTKEQLAGMSDDFLERHKQTDSDLNLYRLTLKYPDIIPIMERCTDRETRKIMNVAFNNRCVEENLPICIEVFKLRKQMSLLLGYSQYSDYALENRMAKKTETVMNFLLDLKQKVITMSRSDLNKLKELAQLENPDLYTTIEPYDVGYFSRLYREKNTLLDEEELRKHFPLDVVTQGMFEIYQTLLGVKFNEITEDHKQKFWHPEVKLFETLDAQTGNIMGYFYLDMFPREGKYSHAAEFGIIPHSASTLPTCIMACNFGKGQNLKFSEVETYFHEFGHVMHAICATSELACFAGTSCERDFVECPSQLLECWTYRPNSLKMMSVDMTDEIVDKLNKKSKMLQGYFYGRQLSFGLYDMMLHSADIDQILSEDAEKRIADMYNDILKETTGLGCTPGTNMVASFGHLMHGYAAGYYGYLWSKVYAEDLFYTKFFGNELNPEVGIQYRKEILSHGGSRLSSESLRVFLGREPNNEAFAKSLTEESVENINKELN